MKGSKKKFEYTTSTGAKEIMEIDGDWFNECDYGIVVDNSQGSLQLMQRLDSLAEMGVQSQKYNFSTIMKLYSTESISEKIRMMEKEIIMRKRKLKRPRDRCRRGSFS